MREITAPYKNIDFAYALYWEIAQNSQYLNGVHRDHIPDHSLWIIPWMSLEGTSAKFNPLATKLSSKGASNFNSVGVKNYPTFTAGVNATYRTLCDLPVAVRRTRGYLDVELILVSTETTFWEFKNAVSKAAWSGQARDGEHYLMPDITAQLIAWSKMPMAGQ